MRTACLAYVGLGESRMVLAEAFLRAIYDHPYDDAPWLIYADWLEEQGDPRADLIRIDRELVPLSADDPRRNDLQVQRGQLLEYHRKEWAPYLKELGGKAHVWCYRGLLDHVRIDDVSDEDLRQLAGRAEIRLLNLEGRGITNAGLLHLMALPGLEELGLGGTAVTDAGMSVLARLPRLLGLSLSETAVTDAGIRHLHKARRLAHIYCDLGEAITEDGLDRWKAQRMRRFRKRPPEARRQEAVYVLESLSQNLRTGDSLGRIDFCQESLVSDADLEYFTAVPEVEELELSMTRVTGRGLRHLAGLKRLRTLHLFKTYVQNFDGLAGLSNLKELFITTDLGAEHLTDDGTAALPALTGLEVLELPFAEITDLTLHRLVGLRRLRVLDLACANGITDDGLAALAHLTRLEYLNLSSSEWRGGGAVTDNGLRHLAGLKELIVLNLEGQPVTDAGLVHLRGLKKLEYLELRGTQVTVGAARQLLAFLPTASIPVTTAMVKYLNPHPHFTRREVDDCLSFEIPDDWEVRGWEVFEQHLQIFEKPFVEQFQAQLREGGYKHIGISGGTHGPGEVSFNRFPVGRKRKLATIHRAFINWGGTENVGPGKPRCEAKPLPSIEAHSWRYQSDGGTEQHLDFGWRDGAMCYLMCCRAPVGRFADLEPLFLHMAHSCRFKANDKPLS